MCAPGMINADQGTDESNFFATEFYVVFLRRVRA
jgi:hypothetical protein